MLLIFDLYSLTDGVREGDANSCERTQARVLLGVSEKAIKAIRQYEAKLSVLVCETVGV